MSRPVASLNPEGNPLTAAGRAKLSDTGATETSGGGRWRDSDYLYQIIETIGSGPDLATMLRGIVNLVTEATSCHACFIYFMEQDRFVLRAASGPYSHLEDKVRFGRDEGLAGWVAKTRRTAFIRERALEDPRVLYVPELEEERFQSLVSVPILSRSSQVAGVISVHASAPHEFRPADREFLESTASLVAGAIENARLYEDATRKVALLSELSRLAQRIAAAGSPEELLPLAVRECRQLLKAIRTELYVVEAEEQLVLAEADPARRSRRPVDLRQLWTSLFDASEEGSGVSQVAAEALWGDAAGEAPLIAPLVAGSERLGLLVAFLERPQPDDRSVLAAVASHTAVAMKHLRLVDWLRQKNLVKDFLDALANPAAAADEIAEMAARLGCQMDAAHVVLVAVPRPRAGPRKTRGARSRPAAPEWEEDPLGRLESRLRLEFQGALMDRRGDTLRGLIRVGPQGPEPTLEAARKAFRQSGVAGLGAIAAGASEVCRGRPELARGFVEAERAARIGPLLKPDAEVSGYAELGAYRYALAAQDGVRDGLQERLGRLLEYERRRGTKLLRTLEVYLDQKGNIARTARVLYMHPNTLRQRLARIETVAALDLEREDWVSLAMAIRTVELRRLEEANGLAGDGQ